MRQRLLQVALASVVGIVALAGQPEAAAAKTNSCQGCWDFCPAPQPNDFCQQDMGCLLANGATCEYAGAPGCAYFINCIPF